MITIRTIRSNRYGNRQFKVVARRSEALRRTDLIAKAWSVANVKGEGKDNKEIDDQRRGYANDWDDLVHNLFPLGGKEDEDRVKQADEGEGADDGDEFLVVEVGGEGAYGKAGDDCRCKGDTEKDGDGGGNCGVGDGDGLVRWRGKYVDEEQGEGSEEDDLEKGVDGYENRAVGIVARSKVGPD